MVTARQVINSTKPVRVRVPRGKTKLGSAGYDNIRDDIEKTKHIREGTIQHIPTNPKDIVNKEYVDDLTIGTYFDFYAYDDNSDVATYKEFKLTPSPDAKVEGNVSIAGNATGQLAGKRITEDTIDIPALMTVISSGVATFHVHLKAATANRLKLYAEVYTRTALGVETLVTTSNMSEYITTTEAEYNLHANITESIPLAAGDRLVVKVYATNSSPAATTLYIYVEGDTATRMNLPGITSPLQHDSLIGLDADDHTQYVKKAGDTMTDTLKIEKNTVDHELLRLARNATSYLSWMTPSGTPQHADLEAHSSTGSNTNTMAIYTTAGGGFSVGDISFGGNIHIGSGKDLTTTENIKSMTHYTDFTLLDPHGLWDIDTQVFMMWAPADLTITKIQVETTSALGNVQGDFKYADDFLSLANAVVINDFDTTSGKRTDTSITSASVASGKAIYIQFDSQPSSTIKQIHFHMEWDFD